MGASVLFGTLGLYAGIELFSNGMCGVGQSGHGPCLPGIMACAGISVGIIRGSVIAPTYSAGK